MLANLPWGLIGFEAFGVVCMGLGYLLGKKGFSGVAQDIRDLKLKITDVENHVKDVKAKLSQSVAQN